jgi:hypothetical protein
MVVQNNSNLASGQTLSLHSGHRENTAFRRAFLRVFRLCGDHLFFYVHAQNHPAQSITHKGVQFRLSHPQPAGLNMNNPQ